MDRGDHKLYHVHDFDSRSYLDTYMSDKDMTFADDIIIFPLKKLHFAFNEGHITGDTIIDISCGSFIYHLYSATNYFKEMIILRASDSCIMEINKWVDTRTGAFDWSHTLEMLAGITGNSDWDIHPHTNLKATIQPVLRCDLNQENLTDPEILPLADCVITLTFLDTTSKDGDDYKRNLKKIVKLMKPGGHLMLIGCLNASFFMMGEEKFHMFKYNEKFVREALIDEGLIIDDCEVHERKVKVMSHLSDYEKFIFISAHKNE
ncbi:indolethylamine N-methyltransferase-like [Anomaloglossus baeobatrachus]|uniref:indolethylamine N-methyltransferase-like n=1 Tax=Anomaloglossus baeobatrachus TaxID=238106 RepID=UPI003F50CEF7